MGNKKVRKWIVLIMVAAMVISGLGMSLSMLITQ